MKKEPPPGFELWSLRLAGCRATISSNLDFQTAPHQLHCLNLNEESWFFKRMFWESSTFWNFLVWRILINLFSQNKFDFWKFQSQECPKLISLQPKPFRIPKTRTQDSQILKNPSPDGKKRMKRKEKSEIRMIQRILILSKCYYDSKQSILFFMLSNSSAWDSLQIPVCPARQFWFHLFHFSILFCFLNWD